MNCLAKDRNGNNCRNYQVSDETRFCRFHQYMNDYTSEMLDLAKLCGGCKKMHYISVEFKTCDPCRSRDKTKYKVPIIPCKYPDCKFKKSEENDYCGKHQLQVFVDETNAAGLKLCTGYKRGCRSQLDSSYMFAKCPECLNKENASDRERRATAKSLVPADENNKICTSCCKEYPLDNFQNGKTLTKTCLHCRTQNKMQDEKRDKEHVNKLTRTNVNRAFYAYQRSAKLRNIEFHLTRDQFDSIITTPCNYCGIIDEEKGFNGIDRIDSDAHYTINNCVSACKFCNYLKHTVKLDTFLQRIEHILTNLGKIQGKLFPSSFTDVISSNYIIYKRDAKTRKLDFELSAEDFINITSGKCYMCGKPNAETHRNGVDRFDNKIGYTLTNARTCCNTCNMLKNDYVYEDLLEKFQRILVHMGK